MLASIITTTTTTNATNKGVIMRKNLLTLVFTSLAILYVKYYDRSYSCGWLKHLWARIR